MASLPSVELINEKTLAEAEIYLATHEDTSQFLINNLRAHGYTITPHHNSGNFKIIRRDGKIEAVFCLTRRGNLVVQASGDFSEGILSACKEESLPLKGFIGDWDSVHPIAKRFKAANPDYKPTYESKEILYSYQLVYDNEKLQHDDRVRFLEDKDFDQWLEFTYAYLSELSLPDELSLEQKKADFKRQIHERICWGLFSGNTLLSRTALNSKGQTVGQVGGVFTPAQYRQRGYAKAAMFHMLKDCFNLHNHTKNILFTGETDIPAQKLYESMGYNRVDSFALILG